MRQVAIPLAIAGGLPARSPAHHTRRSIDGETMGTTWSVELYACPDHPDTEFLHLVSRELDRLVAQMSHWRADSDLSRFNASPPDSWVDLPRELFTVLEASVRIAGETGGAFDATVGPLVDLWGFGPVRTGFIIPPSSSSIAEGVWRRGSTLVRLDPSGSRVWQPGAVSFDLSSIAKGFAVDRVSEVLDLPCVSSCLVEIGGELRSRGVRQSGEPWWVSVETPPDVEDFPETVVALCNLSIATSGDYRRYFEHQGRRYSHTIDPRSGLPVQHSIASVTVIHEECMLADAYSTALAVMGPDDGVAFADRNGLAVQYVLRDGSGCQLRSSESFQQMLD